MPLWGSSYHTNMKICNPNKENPETDTGFQPEDQ